MASPSSSASGSVSNKRCRLLRLSLFHREDSSSDVFSGPENSSPDKHDPVQLRSHPPNKHMQPRPHSQSGCESPKLKKLSFRAHSLYMDTLSGLRGKKGKGAIKGSQSQEGSVKELENYRALGKPGGRRVISSSSSSPAGLTRTSTSSSIDELDWHDVARGGGVSGESGYCGSEEGCGPSSGMLSPSTPISPAEPKYIPKTARAPSSLVRSASDNNCHTRFAYSPSSVSSPSSSPSPISSALQELDIVGESCRSRFPWQRDMAVQCCLIAHDVHNNPHRSRQDRHSYSGHVGSPTIKDQALNTHKDFPLPPKPHPKLSLSSSLQGVSSTEPNPSACVTQRANFTRKLRPRSMGSLENLRYQSELSRFREMISWRGERSGRGDSPPVLQSPPAGWRRLRGERRAESPAVQSPPAGWRRVQSVFQEDGESVSDLESIREYPDECLSDLSRQTSIASFDADDQQLRHSECEPDYLTETFEDFRTPPNVLHSPSVSPLLWTGTDDGDMSDSDQSDSAGAVGKTGKQRNSVRLRRAKLPRRRSSASLTSGSDNEDAGLEPSPPVARRGRRSAIFETKNCGDVSPTTLSPEHSPSNSCDEGDGATNIAERLRRRRSSVDLSMNIYPGDLLIQQQQQQQQDTRKLLKRNTIADFYPPRSSDGQPTSTSDDASKKGRQPFSLLKLMRTRSKENLTRLEDILRRLKPSEFKDNHLAAYKNVHWSDLIASTDKQNPPISISDTERKRREAVWELFKSECVFLIDHCMVLKHCFMEPLKKVQVEGSLMFAEPQDIFGNLDELCYVSYTFCKDFIAALLKDMSDTDFGRTNVLTKAFQRFSTHSKDGAVFHTYCINYTNALTYLEKLRQNSEFAEFERWCEQDARCKRLQLTDLLVAPIQHCTKLPLLLANVAKYTESEPERCLVTESIDSVKTSLQQLEDKLKWLKNVERVQEIQRQLVWPAVADLDSRCVIPDCLKSTLSRQPCERLLTCTQRQLLHEGPLTLMESPKPIDVYAFLFDDMLLITKTKKSARKQKQGLDGALRSPPCGDGTSYVVFRQPLAMDRFLLHDIPASDLSANGLKHVFVLVHLSRFQQILGIFTLQTACDIAKTTWLTVIREAQERYAEKQQASSTTPQGPTFAKDNHPQPPLPSDLNGLTRRDSCLSSGKPVQRNGSLTSRGPTKSRSMDAVYI